MVDFNIANKNVINCHHELANTLGITNMLLKHDKDARITRFDFENSGKPWGSWNRILGTSTLAFDWYKFLAIPGSE